MRRPVALRDARGPSPAAHLGQGRGGEFRGPQSVVHALRILPGERTWAADPAVIGSAAPTGTVSRSPAARSAAATQILASACLRYNCALSPVWSRSAARTGWAMASRRSSPAAAASSAIRGPRMNRPCASRASSRCRSSATASRCAVGLARPVA